MSLVDATAIELSVPKTLNGRMASGPAPPERITQVTFLPMLRSKYTAS